VGASGKVLDQMLEHIGLARRDVYITNVVKDRPPENRDPTQSEIDLYTPFLTRQIDLIQPKVIATLGRFAMDYIFELLDMVEQGKKISDMHGQTLTAQASYGKVAVVPLYHPAVALYNANQRGTLMSDFEALKAFI
jgi:DNA polymerase